MAEEESRPGIKPWGPCEDRDFHIISLPEYCKNLLVSSDPGSTMNVLVRAKNQKEEEESDTLAPNGEVQFTARDSKWKEFSVKGLGRRNQLAYGQYRFW